MESAQSTMRDGECGEKFSGGGWVMRMDLSRVHCFYTPEAPLGCILIVDYPLEIKPSNLRRISYKELPIRRQELERLLGELDKSNGCKGVYAIFTGWVLC